MPEEVYMIDGLKLVLTCHWAPESYDVVDSRGHMVGCLRLRHGMFTAHYPGVGGQCVYQAYTKGDGEFHVDERLPHLNRAVQLLNANLRRDSDG